MADGHSSALLGLENHREEDPVAAEPFRSLEQYETRYERLEQTFVTWHGIAKTLPMSGTPPLLSSMLLGTIDPDQPRFSVKFAGTLMYIRLLYLPGSEHGDRGQLVPYTLDPISGAPAMFPALAFEGSGETTLHFDNGDAVQLCDPPGAFHVLGLLVKTVLERK